MSTSSVGVERILAALADASTWNSGLTPTLAELAEHVGRSRSTVHKALRRAEAEGRVRITPRASRGIVLLGHQESLLMPHVATIAKTFRFEASHQLPNHDGRCARLHGHSYVCEVALRGPVREATGLPDEGMVVDFYVLSSWWNQLDGGFLDHRHLNDSLPSAYQPTTAENIARFILDRAVAEFGPLVAYVRLHETASSVVEVTP